MWSPKITEARKRSTAFPSGTVIERLNEITDEEGMKRIEPRLIDGKRFKVANAYCVGLFRPKMCMTDYLYENLSENEIVAMLAHEMGHLKYRHILKKTLPLIIVFTVASIISILLGLDFAGYIHIHFTWAEGVSLPSPIPLVAPLAIVAALLGSIRAKKGETAADRFALKYSSYEDLAIGLIKAQYLNHVPINYIGGSHPALITRIGKMKKFAEESGSWKKAL